MESIQYQKKIDEWKSIIHQLYSDKNITLYSKKDDFGTLSFQRTKLKGLWLSKWEFYFQNEISFCENIIENHFNMFFVLKGNFNVSIDETSKNLLNGENNILIVPCNSKGLISFKPKIQHSYWVCSLSQNFLKVLIEKYPHILRNLFTKLKHGKICYLRKNNLINSCEMNLILSQIENADVLGKTKNMYVESKILELLSLQLTYSENESKTHCFLNHYEIQKINEAKEILLKNLSGSPTIKKLSEMIGLNEKKLKYGFKEIHHLSIYQYLFNHKMNLAQELLRDSNIPVSEVGLMCGYDYASHFNKAFKRKYGTTPLQFRKSKFNIKLEAETSASNQTSIE